MVKNVDIRNSKQVKLTFIITWSMGRRGLIWINLRHSTCAQTLAPRFSLIQWVFLKWKQQKLVRFKNQTSKILDDNNWLNLEDNHNLESHQHHHYQQQTTILTPTTMPTKKSCFKSATKDMPYLYCQMSGSSTRSGSQRKVRF